jgi:hypothetical protein
MFINQNNIPNYKEFSELWKTFFIINYKEFLILLESAFLLFIFYYKL